MDVSSSVGHNYKVFFQNRDTVNSILSGFAMNKKLAEYGFHYISQCFGRKSSLASQLLIEPVTSPIQHGEGPFWDSKTQSLYFLDTFKATLLKWKKSKNNIVSHQFDGDSIGLVVPVKNRKNTFIVCRDRYINLLSWDSANNNTGTIKHLTYVDHSQENNQFNDGKVDANGRLWAGTLTRNKDLSVGKDGGLLYMIKGGCGITVEKKLSPLTISNGITWSNDNKKIFHIDSATRRVDSYDFNLLSGNMDNQQTILDLDNYADIKGIPDGMTIDADDNLWVAVFGGKLVLKVNSTSGELIQRIEMPVTYVTSLAIGGDNLDVLYVTTSRLHLTQDQILQEPLAGSVFAIQGVGVRGYSPHRYRLYSNTICNKKH
ncbi:hypothetical protein RI129_001641 [Pyrocoelia pectoralis]|uniref:Regucalcin n=1 Tax=Pyrocoelia pectoralis TaxID=417401 RepID=A0AAN7ZTN2_9COLE